MQALNENKLDQAEKHLAEAIKLAPGHPDVLFLQGVLYLSRRNWTDAQTALEKATQLDPVNARLGAESLTGDFAARRYDRLINLLASGFACGGLWEFLNYWSRAKWHYTVPILEHVKIFEMPLPGYLGFPAFALECFTMYVFIRLVFVRVLRTWSVARIDAGRPIAL